MKKNSKFYLVSLVLFPLAVFAQDVATPTPTPTASASPTIAVVDPNIVTSRGIQNGLAFDMDKKERDPEISVSAEYVKVSGSKPAHGKILVDARVINSEFQGYPIKFDLFVNGKLIESQVRSPQLVRPIGLEVPENVATVPFNYTVVATILHPNRSFTSVIEGALFSTNLARSIFNCELTIPGVENVYLASVPVRQSAENQIDFSFETETFVDSSKASNKVFVIGNLTLSGESMSGTLNTSIDGQSSTTDVSGDATTEGGVLSDFSVNDEGATVVLECEVQS